MGSPIPHVSPAMRAFCLADGISSVSLRKVHCYFQILYMTFEKAPFTTSPVRHFKLSKDLFQYFHELVDLLNCIIMDERDSDDGIVRIYFRLKGFHQGVGVKVPIADAHL